jgi:hypothetical protein
MYGYFVIFSNKVSRNIELKIIFALILINKFNLTYWNFAININ